MFVSAIGIIIMAFGNKNSDSYEIGNIILNIYDISTDEYELYIDNYTLKNISLKSLII